MPHCGAGRVPAFLRKRYFRTQMCFGAENMEKNLRFLKCAMTG